MKNRDKNIYIVEDQGVTRIAIKSMLIDAGYEISGDAATAEKAWLELQSFSTDLVLIDFNLKGTKNGLWLAEKINTYLQIPFIYLTAYGSEDFLQRILKSKPAGYIMKPYNKPTLLTAVQIAIENNVKTKKESTSENEVFLKTKKGIVRFTCQNIYYLQSNKNYIEIYTPTENYIIREKLKILLQRLNFDDLYRIHRRFAVNINHVDKIDAEFVYVNNQSLPISKTYQAELLIKNCIQIKG